MRQNSLWGFGCLLRSMASMHSDVHVHLIDFLVVQVVCKPPVSVCLAVTCTWLCFRFPVVGKPSHSAKVTDFQVASSKLQSSSFCVLAVL